MAFHKERKAEGTLLVTKVRAFAPCFSGSPQALAAAAWVPPGSPVRLTLARDPTWRTLHSAKEPRLRFRLAV